MHDLNALANRLVKIHKARRKWAQRLGTEAYRVYERDIPELPLIVDLYADQAVVYDKSREEAPAFDPEALTSAVSQALKLDPGKVHLKLRRRMKGTAQYEKLAETGAFFPVREGSAQYLVNLTDYLDSGLFLDHRPLRQRFAEGIFCERFLNLFCYTGSVSVAAALGGARVTSVDMSNTYLDWAKKNFELNGLDEAAHQFVREDALVFLEQGPAKGGDRYDVVFLDPPTFSNSKKMQGSFDVQRDHRGLIERTMAFLAPGGVLYFSTNRRRFRLDDEVLGRYAVKDITAETIPDDFRDKQIHKCFVLSPHPARRRSGPS